MIAAPPRPAPAAVQRVQPVPRADRRPLAALGALLALYVVIAAAYALIVPRWYAPDEPAHYNYACHIARTATFPILQPGDFPASYLDALKSAKPPFPREASTEMIRYEAHQPPLYYLLAAAVCRVAEPISPDGAWLALRGLSIALGTLTVVLAYLLARTLFPDQPAFALLAAAFPVAVPMHVAMTAAINNDTLAEVVLGAIVLVLARGVIGGFTRRRCVLLGLLLGAALLTKLVDYVALGLIPLGLLLRAWVEEGAVSRAGQERAGLNPHAENTNPPAGAETISRVAPAVSAPKGVRHFSAGVQPRAIFGAGSMPAVPTLLRRLAFIYLIAALVAGWWFVRAMVVYGPADPLGLVRHDLVMGEEPRTYQYVEKLGLGGALQRFAGTLGQSFWAQFGWMSILIDQRLYVLLNVLSGLAGLGLLIAVIRWWWASAERGGGNWRAPAYSRARGAALLVALAAVGIVAATLLYYNLRFWQPQGRYLFPAIVPLAIFAVLGLRSLAPGRAGLALTGAVFAALIALNAVCLRLYIIPFFQ